MPRAPPLSFVLAQAIYSREIGEEGEEGKGVITDITHTFPGKITLVFLTSQNLKECSFVCFTMETFGSSGFSLLSLKTLSKYVKNFLGQCLYVCFFIWGCDIYIPFNFLLRRVSNVYVHTALNLKSCLHIYHMSPADCKAFMLLVAFTTLPPLLLFLLFLPPVFSAYEKAKDLFILH